MSLDIDVPALLRTIVPNSFPDGAPVNTPRPYLVYTRIGGRSILPLGREVPGKENGVFQIDVWDSTRLGANALAKAIDAAFRVATQFQASPVSEAAWRSDVPLVLYGTSQDFSVWADR